MEGCHFFLFFLPTNLYGNEREPELTLEVTGVKLQQNKKRRQLTQPGLTHSERGHLGLESSKSFQMLRQRKAGWPLLGRVCV